LLLHHVSDDYALDGYRVIRHADISHRLAEFERRPLVEAALRMKEQAPQAPQATIDLLSMSRAMESAQANYPVLVLAREAEHLDEVQLGTVRLASAATYVLRSLTPQALWLTDNHRYSFSGVTMLQFAGQYEQTLAQVAKVHPGGV
jgi:hypothetical protein